MADKTVDITNNTMAPYVLPPVPGRSEWPNGITLPPGLNRVPQLYIDAWTNYSTAVTDSEGKPVIEVVKEKVSREVGDGKTKTVVTEEVEVPRPARRYPGREAFAKLTQRAIRRVTANGVSYGPALTLHREGEIDRNAPLGPPPPVDLPANEKAAAEIIRLTVDREALERWKLYDARPDIRAAVGVRLEQLR